MLCSGADGFENKALNSARTQLGDASSDKAGHRVKALQLVDEAIGEVRAGIVAGAF